MSLYLISTKNTFYINLVLSANKKASKISLIIILRQSFLIKPYL